MRIQYQQISQKSFSSMSSYSLPGPPLWRIFHKIFKCLECKGNWQSKENGKDFVRFCPDIWTGWRWICSCNVDVLVSATWYPISSVVCHSWSAHFGQCNCTRNIEDFPPFSLQLSVWNYKRMRCHKLQIHLKFCNSQEMVLQINSKRMLNTTKRV